MVSHPCVSRPGRRLDQVRGDHQLPRIIKPRSRRKPTFIYHQVDALSCCRNHQVRMDCALIIIPFCRYKWNAILAMMTLAYLKAEPTEGEKRAAFSQQSTTQISYSWNTDFHFSSPAICSINKKSHKIQR